MMNYIDKQIEPSIPLKRILLCIPSLAGGGAERQLVYLCEGLVRTGWKITVALLQFGPNKERLLKTGVDIKILRHNTNYDPRIVWQLITIIRSQKPDIIQTWLPTMNTLGGIAAGFTKTLLVGSERNSRPECKVKWKDTLQMTVLSTWATAVIANSVPGKRYLDSTLKERVKIYVVPNGLPLFELDAVIPCDYRFLGFQKDTQVILYAGRIEAQKNLSIFFSALSNLLKINSKATAIICGEGSEKKQWGRWVDQNGLSSRVYFLGYVDNLWALMKSSDVFVSPSTYEGQPNTVMEAMACKCALVISDIPEHREFLDDTSALFVQPDNADEFVEAILETLNNRHRTFQRIMNARKLVSKYSIENMANGYHNIYNNLLEMKANCYRSPNSYKENIMK